MKRNTLYTANSFNQRLFYSEGGKRHTGKPVIINKWNQPAFMQNSRINTYDIGGLLKGAGDALGGVMGGGKLAGSPVGGLVGGVSNMVGGIAKDLIGGGYSSGAGNAVAGVGSQIGGLVSNFNPVLGAGVTLASNVLGGGINALWGTKVDQAKLKAAQEGTNTLLNYKSDAESLDDIKGITASSSVQDAHAGGVFKKEWAAQKNAQIRGFRNDALAFADRSQSNNIFNLTNDQANEDLASYHAYGGPINTEDANMSAIYYNFMDRYMTAKEKQNESKNKISNIPSMPAFMQNGFALGGDTQMHGGDYKLGQIYEVTEEEANRLKAMGYGFTVVR